MKPEYTGNVLASRPLGGVNVAVMVCVSPAARVRVVWLSAIVAASVVSGTGAGTTTMVP